METECAEITGLAMLVAVLTYEDRYGVDAACTAARSRWTVGCG